jgi:hypothetical protein
VNRRDNRFKLPPENLNCQCPLVRPVVVTDPTGRSQGFTGVLSVYNRIKLQVDLQADKSPVVVKGPFFPRVVNPSCRIRGTMRDARVDLVKPINIDIQEVKPMHLISKNIKTNLIY